MTFDVWNFLNLRRSINSQADKVLENIYVKVSKVILKLTRENFDNNIAIDDVIKKQLESSSDSVYFYEWLNEQGLKSIRKISEIEFGNSEDLISFLEYREMMLEFDIENNIEESIYTSIAETITAIEEYLDTYLQQAASINNISSQDHFVGKFYSNNSEIIVDNFVKPHYKKVGFSVIISNIWRGRDGYKLCI